MILVQALPKIINYVAVFLASVILVVTGILILANQTNGWEGKEGWRIIIGVFLLIFGILFMIMLVLYHRHLRMIGILLKYAG